MEENKATDGPSQKEQIEYSVSTEERKVSFSSKGVFKLTIEIAKSGVTRLKLILTCISKYVHVLFITRLCAVVFFI